MRYDDRVQVVTVTTSEGYLGDKKEIESEPETALCAISGLTNSDKQTYFRDNYKIDAFKVHLKGDQYKNVKYIIYNGVKHEVVGKTFARSNLVVIVA
ncbi:hypothetical protein ACSAHR_03925 [Pediococcus pentosaceus]|jgi:hypothetical protein|uniref:hypothetical protein n=1 Tax=Pediococcus pentosaceus TaxID=1255 RepID=UPI0018A128B7|nr:hypothetical protein [Pediococcus pentosaceus]MBF7122895.1 hypothetical protein [Pediococcus pentosaceus]MCS8562733.1 hypothetical protein [Pediococcus pentosaceus]MCS8566948.1 hypothetical protein [Pediococcus pentosaceus]MCS8579811.1 hypothetical protein [Pediococcus pentosaceus]MCT3032573.1 hypothetical protein [Pediococcus pentosaceus]